MRYLEEKYGATAEELAAWIYMGLGHGGLRAYRPAHNDRVAARFFFEPEMSADYVSEMLDCYFREEEVRLFVPSERYTTGAALKVLWANQLGERVLGWIRQLIEQDKLIEVHPTRGAVATDPSADKDLPAMEFGLFPLSPVQEL